MTALHDVYIHWVEERNDGRGVEPDFPASKRKEHFNNIRWAVDTATLNLTKQ